MGRHGAVLGASWAVLERRGDEKARTLNSFENLRGTTGFCILGPSWEGFVLWLSWDVLEASWAVLRPSWASWADCSATRGFLDRHGGLLGPSWLRKSHATRRREPHRARDKPQEICEFWVRALLNNPQDLGLRLRGLIKGPEDTSTRAPKARWRIWMHRTGPPTTYGLSVLPAAMSTEGYT